MKFRSDVNGLRAIAVIAVVIFHFDASWLAGGFAGVDMFFVISGFVITRSLMSNAHTHIGRYLLEFYIRRIKRLVPALAFVVVLGAVFTVFFDPTPKTSILTGVTAMFGLSNVFLIYAAQDYFAVSTEFNTFTHTWSLGVEEQYYILYPILFFGFATAIRAGSTRIATSALLFLSALSLVLFEVLLTTNPTAGFYLMPSRFWEFASGCLLCFYKSNSNERSAFIVSSLSFGVLLFCLSVPAHFSYLTTPLTILATAGLILFSAKNSILRALLTNRAMHWIGLASYSIYLWHWPVLSISRWTVGVSSWTIVPQLMLILVMAAISYHLIETPLRSAQWSKRRSANVAIGLSISCAAAALAMIIWYPMSQILFLGTRNGDESATSSPWLAEHSEISVTARHFADSCNITPHKLSGDRYRPKPTVDQAFFDRCLNVNAERSRIILIGDSFASRSVEHVAVLAEQMHMDFGVIFGYGCPYPLPLAKIDGNARKKCPEIEEAVLFRAVQNRLRSGDILVLRLHLANQQYVRYSLKQLPPITAYDMVLVNLASEITNMGASLLLVGSNPTLSALEAPSLEREWYNSLISVEEFGAENTPETEYFHQIDQHLIELSNKNPDLTYFSLVDWFCGPTLACRLSKDERLYYQDMIHLSPLAYDVFREALREQLGDVVSN